MLVASDRDAAINLVAPTEPAVVTLDLGLPPDPDGVSEGFAALENILTLKPDDQGDRRLGPRRARKRAAGDRLGRL